MGAPGPSKHPWPRVAEHPELQLSPRPRTASHASWSSYQSHGGKQLGLTLKGMTQLWNMYASQQRMDARHDFA
jgi:hypothetical protein